VPEFSLSVARPLLGHAAPMVILCLTLTACGWLMPPPQTRGNKVEAEQLKELVPGTSTKADVTALIGSPTQKATFDESSWLYITETTRPRVGQTLGVLDQGVVVLTFDEPAIAIGTKLVITGPEGPVQIGKPSLVDNTVTQDLQPGSPAGAYTVDWRVTSADGHPISGSFTFTAEAAASGPSAASSLAPQPSTAATSATTPTAPTARGSSGLWLVAAAILVVASGLIAIGRRRRLTSGDRS